MSHYFKIFFLLTCTQYITQNHFPQALSHERNMWRKEKCIQYDSSWRLNYSSIMRKCVINIIFPFCKKMKMSFLNLKVFYLLQSAKTRCRTWKIGFNFVAFSICLRIHFRLKMDIYNGETDSLLLSIGKLLLRLLIADIWILNTSKHINQQLISICIWNNILPDLALRWEVNMHIMFYWFWTQSISNWFSNIMKISRLFQIRCKGNISSIFSCGTWNGPFSAFHTFKEKKMK